MVLVSLRKKRAILLNVESEKTSWVNVLVLIGAGAAVALQVGKVPAALPALQEELGLSLVESGWVVAIFSLIAAGLAAFLGSISDRYGQLRVAIFGMLLSVVAGFAGGFAPNGFILLATRTLEGMGFILTSVSIPPLIALAVSERHRRASMALWGTYMPIGSGIMLLISGPLLYLSDWRTLWWVTSILILVFSVIVFRVGKQVVGDQPVQTAPPKFSDILKVARRPGPLLMSIIFAFYAGQYLVLAGFLPLMLVEINGYTPIMAALVSAVVVLLNGLGNAISGWLLSRGFNPVSLILTGCIAMSIGAGISFWGDLSAPARIFGAALFTGFGGLIPSSLFAEVPRHARRQSYMASVSGMLVQGAAIGQLVGPPIIASVVAFYGNWQAAIPGMMACAAITGCAALVLSYLETKEVAV